MLACCAAVFTALTAATTAAAAVAASAAVAVVAAAAAAQITPHSASCCVLDYCYDDDVLHAFTTLLAVYSQRCESAIHCAYTTCSIEV
eukprot:7774-Heterococcus_DN1.PRE.1